MYLEQYHFLEVCLRAFYDWCVCVATLRTGVTLPQDLKKVSDQQLQALGMRPAEQRKLRKISEKAVIQGHGKMSETADGSMQRQRTHTDL